jgi:hypothetical protein
MRGVRHGWHGTPEYNAWRNMKARVIGRRLKERRIYKLRNIKVCKRWLESFSAFLQDMGPKPSAKLSLDRINNGGDYSPKNCRWATSKQQANNRRARKRREFCLKGLHRLEGKRQCRLCRNAWYRENKKEN